MQIEKILSKETIKELIVLLKQVFLYIQELKEKESCASYIQYPKIPKVLSESLCYYFLKEKLILAHLSIQEIIINNNIADLILKTNGKDIKVEVKATGISAFQNLGIKDINADYLIWIHFDSYFFKNSSDSVEIFIIENPSQYFPAPIKITLKELQKRVPLVTKQIIDISTLVAT